MRNSLKLLALTLATSLLLLAALARHPGAQAQEDILQLAVDTVNHRDAYIYKMIQRDDYLYTLASLTNYLSTTYLHIYDISNPLAPQVVAETNIEGAEMAVEGDYVYVKNGGILRVVDISDPANPIQLSAYNDFEQYQGLDAYVSYVAARGHIVYVTLNYSGDWCTIYGKVAVLDVSDPANPVRVGTILSGGLGGVGRLATWKDNLYILLTFGMLHYDISDPAHPAFAGDIGFGYVHHESGSLVIANDQAYVTYYDFGNPCYVGGEAGWYVVDLDGYHLAASYPGRIRYITGSQDGYLYTYDYIEGFQMTTAPAYDTPVATADFGDTRPGAFAFSDGFIIARTSRNYHLYGLDTFRLSADSVAVGPGQAGELVYTDTLGLVTSLQLGAGAVLSPTVVSVLPLPPAGGQLPGWLARQVFDLAGYLPDDRQVLTGFQEPVTATLPYSPTTFPQGWWVGWWNGHSWVDAGSTCPTDRPTDRSTDRSTDLSNLGDLTNLIQQPLCAVGKYALFFDPYEAFLPRVRR